jgi:hypothetical protein
MNYTKLQEAIKELEAEDIMKELNIEDYIPIKE